LLWNGDLADHLEQDLRNGVADAPHHELLRILVRHDISRARELLLGWLTTQAIAEQADQAKLAAVTLGGGAKWGCHSHGTARPNKRRPDRLLCKAADRPARDVQHRATIRAPRSTAHRVQALKAEADELEHEIAHLVTEAQPQLVQLPGVGSISAAQLLISWSHPGRLRSEAAFATLAGAAPIPASSGLTNRPRLNRGGDRQLNRALHTIVLTRSRTDPATRAYITRRLAEGKTLRETKRCLKRIIARQLFRVLQQRHQASETAPDPLDAT
jgi:transposase